MEEKNNIRPGRPKNNSSGSGDKFSFPIFPLVEEEDNDHGSGGGFEFGGCATDHSDSPNSPADHLFFNGRLLPHAFPCQPPTTTVNTFSSFSRSTSVTSSVSSKDYSFVSSRSNSRSSSCSSARTSISTTESAILSERKVLITHSHHPKVSSSTSRRSVTRSSSSSPHYGTSRRWQFLITPAAPPPAALILKKKKKKQQHHQLQQEGKVGSRGRKAVENGEREELKCKKKANKTWFWWRFFRSFVSACKECHAISPSPRNDPPN